MIEHPGGVALVLSEPHPQFVAAFEALIPTRARVYNARQGAWLVVAPFDTRAISLVSKWHAVERQITTHAYDWLATDARLVLQRQAEVGR